MFDVKLGINELGDLETEIKVAESVSELEETCTMRSGSEFVSVAVSVDTEVETSCVEIVADIGADDVPDSVAENVPV
jgi:hypothetical protein